MRTVLAGRSSSTAPDRAQSEVIGIILLTAVVILLVSVAGAVFLSSLESQTDRDPRANIDSSVDGDTITISHQGGDSFDADQVEVILRGDGEFSAFLDAEDGAFLRGTDEDRFEPGDRWRISHGVGPGAATLFVIDRESGTILHEASHEVDAE